MEVIKRVRAPLDYLNMRALDTSQVVNTMSTKHVALVSWMMPVGALRTGIHKRFEVEAFAEAPNGDEKMPMGLVTLMLGQNIPSKTNFFERLVDPGPHYSMALRISTMDRVHWQRSIWCNHSVCKSIFWGKAPHDIYGLDIEFNSPVVIDAQFDKEAGKYSKYTAKVEKYGLEIELEDTGVPMLDPSIPTVPGFLDNESALKNIGMSREVCMKGVGGCVYRQTLWSTPSLPNNAKVVKCDVSGYFMERFGHAPEFGPVSAWLLDEVPETKVYQMEAQIESENDPNTATYFGDKALHERVQKKAMNRYNDFRDNVRTRSYSDIEGTEMPR